MFNNFCNLFYNLTNINVHSDTEDKKNNENRYLEKYIVKPIFYTITYILLIFMLLLFAIVKILKYIIELTMDFADKDETKIYDRLIYNYK